LTTGLNEVRGVWFHPEGGFLVATHKGGDVWYVDTDGIIHRLIRGDDDRDTHAGDGELLDTPGKKLSEVRAVTMGPGGRMVVTENDRGFIRVVEGL
jgi:glucose/arabinose dehydrogenase